jgi:hypothetical protein
MDEIKVIIDKDYVALVKEIKDQVKSAQLSLECTVQSTQNSSNNIGQLARSC